MSNSRPDSGRPGVRSAVALCVTLGLAAWSLVSELRVATEPADHAVLAEAIERVRAEWAPGDVVVVLPDWDERAWAGLEGAGDGAEAWPFEALWGEGPLDAADLIRWQRAWVVATHDRVPALPLAESDHTEEWRDALGRGVTLARFRLPAWRPVARLTESLGDARVRRVTASGEVTPCEWRSDKHRCGLDSWLDVRVERRDVGHRDLAWVYAHPGPDDTRLELEWGTVPAGGSALIRIGFTQASTRHDEGSATTVRLRLGDVDAGDLELVPTRYGIERMLVTADSAAPLVVEVSAADPRWREVMLEADIMEAVPASLLDAGRP